MLLLEAEERSEEHGCSISDHRACIGTEWCRNFNSSRLSPQPESVTRLFNQRSLRKAQSEWKVVRNEYAVFLVLGLFRAFSNSNREEQGGK